MAADKRGLKYCPGEHIEHKGDNQDAVHVNDAGVDAGADGALLLILMSFPNQCLN